VATYHYILSVDRGVSWDEAIKAWHCGARGHKHEGFYLHTPAGSKCQEALLVLALPTLEDLAGEHLADLSGSRLIVLRPHMGPLRHLGSRLVRPEVLASMQRCSPEASGLAKEAWNRQFGDALRGCLHEQRGLPCPQKGRCCMGRRVIQEHVLAGNVLTAWTLVGPGTDAKTQPHADDLRTAQRGMPVVRAVADDGETIVGVAIRPDTVEEVKYVLQCLDAAFPTGGSGESGGTDGGSTVRADAVSDQERADALRLAIVQDLQSRLPPTAPWGSWWQVHQHLVHVGKANNSPVDIHGVQQAMMALEGFGTILVDRELQYTALQSAPPCVPGAADGNPNFRVLHPTAAQAEQLADWASVMKLATDKVPGPSGPPLPTAPCAPCKKSRMAK